MKTKRTDRNELPTSTANVFTLVPLAEIELDPDNVRQTLERASLQELAASIRAHGVLQPILLRPILNDDNPHIRWRVIAGERRYRAAQIAGLTEIPAQLRTLSADEDGADLQLIENLQREDVHPLEEALGLQRMQQGLGLDVKTLAQRLGKDARYIARRLKLVALIPAAKKDFRQERITLAHALELCVLAPDVQALALEACFETKSEWDAEQESWQHRADREQPVRHVRYLQEWITHHVHLNLREAPFATDDTRLREDGLTCLDCPQRSGHDQTLFADLKDHDVCLHPPCYVGKLRTFLHLQKTALEAKTAEPVWYISSHYGTPESEDILSRDAYQLLPKRADRCRFAERAVYADGQELGHVKWICREPICQLHAGASSRPFAPSQATPDKAQRREIRRQEIFDLKVDEAVRLRVMQAALPTYTEALTRTELQPLAQVLFSRLLPADQQTIRKVLNWEEDFFRQLRYHPEQLTDYLTECSDTQLNQFLILCSIAHYGANPARVRPVEQTEIHALSQARSINHVLIDAQVRCEKCPKKYKERHQNYLALVKQGQTPPKPTVTERNGNTQTESAPPPRVRAAQTA